MCAVRPARPITGATRWRPAQAKGVPVLSTITAPRSGPFPATTTCKRANASAGVVVSMPAAESARSRANSTLPSSISLRVPPAELRIDSLNSGHAVSTRRTRQEASSATKDTARPTTATPASTKRRDDPTATIEQMLSPAAITAQDNPGALSQKPSAAHCKATRSSL